MKAQTHKHFKGFLKRQATNPKMAILSASFDLLAARKAAILRSLLC